MGGGHQSMGGRRGRGRARVGGGHERAVFAAREAGKGAEMGAAESWEVKWRKLTRCELGTPGYA